MPSLDSLDALLEEELKDIYDAEKQITKALPKMIKKAGAAELKEGLEEHLHQTEQQIARLEQVFEHMEMPVRGKKCLGMENLIKEGDEMIGEAEDAATRDAIIIAAAQKVEHYEIASYGTVRTWATLLGRSEVASLLEETLDEEKETDQRLTGIAESFVNRAAAEGGDESEGEDVPSSGRGAARARGTTGAAGRGGGRHVAADHRTRGGGRSGSARGGGRSGSGSR